MVGLIGMDLFSGACLSFSFNIGFLPPSSVLSPLLLKSSCPAPPPGRMLLQSAEEEASAASLGPAWRKRRREELEGLCSETMARCVSSRVCLAFPVIALSVIALPVIAEFCVPGTTP